MAAKNAELMKALQNKPVKAEPKKAVHVKAAPTSGGRGKPFNTYLHAEDIATIRQLFSALAAHGVRASDTHVLKVALEYAKDAKVESLLSASRTVAERDQRFKKATA